MSEPSATSQAHAIALAAAHRRIKEALNRPLAADAREGVTQQMMDEIGEAARAYYALLEKTPGISPQLLDVASAIVKDAAAQAEAFRASHEVTAASSTDLVSQARPGDVMLDALMKASGGRIWQEEGPDGHSMGVVAADGTRTVIAHGATKAEMAAAAQDPAAMARFRDAMERGVKQQRQ